jgi:hypothetical protein
MNHREQPEQSLQLMVEFQQPFHVKQSASGSKDDPAL